MDKVLVTGAAGFIGSHLVDKLLDMGYEVIGIDNLSTGTLDNLNKNIKNKYFKFKNVDICQLGNLRKVFIQYKPRAVFHEAAVASMPLSIKKPDLINEINVSGTINILMMAKDYKTDRVIFASSSAVYGLPRYLPYDEEHPAEPITPYGTSKRAAELYCKTFGFIYGLETVILRYFNVYGPRQKYSRECGVMTKFINRALKGLPLQIYGDGKQARDFVYVTDIVQANIKALLNKRAAGGIYNVGTGKILSIKTLTNLILKIARIDNVRIIHLRPREGDVKRGYANINKIHKELKFDPQISIEEGIKRTINAQVS